MYDRKNAGWMDVCVNKWMDGTEMGWEWMNGKWMYRRRWMNGVVDEFLSVWVVEE